MTENEQFMPSADQPTAPFAVTALASPRSRFWASVIDVLILVIPLVLLTAGPWAPFPNGLMQTVVQLAIQITYGGALLMCFGRTLGMRALNIRVISITADSELTAGQSWLRTAAFSLPSLLPTVGVFWGLIDCGWLLWDKPNRQTLHDKIARTIVVTTHSGLD